jgi:cytochrome P450
MDQVEALPLFPFDRPDDGPPAEFDAFRKEGRLKKVRLRNGNTAWLATHYDDVRALLADNRFSNDPQKEGYPQLSPSRPVIATNAGITPILFTDPPLHTRYRRQLTREFAFARVQELQPLIETVIADLIDKMLEHGPPVDLIKQFALPVPTTIILKLLGIPYSDHEFFHERANRMLATDLDPALVRQAQQEMRGRLSEIIHEKAKNPEAHDDIMGRLISDGINTGNLNYEEESMLCQSLVIAGHETTASMIGLGTLSLFRNRAAFERLRNDTSSDLVITAVEEMLRFWSIVNYQGMRVALEDVEFAGVTIKAGDGILPQVVAANHDPEAFPDPENFDIERQSKRPHVAFGFGIHQCIGQQLSRMELKAVFSTLPKRIPTLRLAVPFEDLKFVRGSLTHGLIALPVTW